MKIHFETFGCKLNSEESSKLINEASDYGLTVTSSEPDIVVINSCSVTHSAERKVRRTISKYKREGIYTVLTGCYLKESEADLFIPNDRKEETVQEIIHQFSIEKKEAIVREKDKTRGFLKIQNGCNAFCSFCIIPYARGRSKSEPLEEILSEYRHLVEDGYKEIVLTGIHISSYGLERGETLGSLLVELSKIDSKVRLRLGSLEPRIITEEFLEIAKSFEGFCPQFHLSLQSGSDKVLKEMNRKYTTKEYLEKVHKVRKAFPQASLTTDVIVGYPTEREEDFIKTLDFVQEVRFSKIHAFPFSSREGTKAAMLIDLPKDRKKRRLDQLLHIASVMEREYMESFLSKEVEVLFERNKGLTREYLPVVNKGYERNQLVKGVVTGFDADHLVIEERRD